MWFFNSPEVVFGEDALNYLENLVGKRAMIVTDHVLVKLGYVKRVKAMLESQSFQVQVFDSVEPDPSIETVRKGAEAMLAFQPDWIVGLGGGSSMDAAKAMWVLYERPDMEPEGINPIEKLGLRAKARFIAIPTTSGTGSEATWAIVLSNLGERRKLALGSREALADIAILDPSFVMNMPARLTADTGLDALTHAVEGMSNLWKNDFSDGLCLKAAQLIFMYLPRAYRDGNDVEARFHMQNAACIAGLGFGNANCALAHSLGHSMGGVFHIPHGRAVSLVLPYSIEFCINGEGGNTHYTELAHILELPHGSEKEAGKSLAAAIRKLEKDIEQPLTLEACGVSQADFERDLKLLVENAANDTTAIMATRMPDDDQMRRLFLAIYKGDNVDF
jgi:alcohol dehydrogenase class IV